MIFTCSSEEVEQFIKAYNGQNVGVSCNGFLNIDASVSILGVKMGITLTASDTLNITVAKGTIAGINFTGLVRNKVFNMLQAYNNDTINFSLVNNIIVLKVAKVNFTNVNTIDQIVVEFNYE